MGFVAPSLESLSLDEREPGDVAPPGALSLRDVQGSNGVAYARRTQTLRPIDAKNAGRGISKRRLGRKEVK